MLRRTPHTHLLFAVMIATLIGGMALLLSPAAQAQRADHPVTRAWQAAQTRTGYHFDADLTQVTMPMATAANVGRSARTDRVLLRGQADLAANRLELRLWNDSGSLTDPASGLELRVEQGRTLGRQGGGEWRELGGVTDSLAPQGDLLAYLAAVRNVRELGQEERAGRSFTRYAFTLDGPQLAGYLRDQLEQQLHAAGELPPGTRLEVADGYARVEGTGELWVDSQGLPLRQILELRFPEQGGERVGATIVVDFSRFGPSREFTLLTPELTMSSLAILLGLTMMVGLMSFRNSHRLRVALAAALILATVGGPLLGNLRLRGFLDAQVAHAAERTAASEESDLVRTLRELSSGAQFDPQANPLTSPPPVAAPQAFDLTAVANPNGDDDGDGLSNAVEAYLGTSSSTEDADGDGIPDGRDSDGDGIDDYTEVYGFTLGGRTWYGDPLSRDSNGDGISDTQEWLNDADGDGLPDDTDGDGVPDLFDRDNDGDGVPDRFDLSPQQVGRPAGPDSFFNEQQPLRVNMRGLRPDTQILLDLQLRPADDEQLWFAQSVLDWPMDRRGQYQDSDGATYADLARAEGRIPDPSEYNGDMKLIPMLEIRTPSSAGLLPQERLTSYNLSLSIADDGSRLLYAPLSIVSDQETGARVAFNARLPYLPGPAVQEIRLVWAVQLLADICAESVRGECVRYEQLNVPQVIQTYYEPWYLTGALLREDHGTTIAAIYEDPAAPAETDLREDGSLWLLTHGLDSSFLGGRQEQGQRDLDLSEIARRFDRLNNAAVSEEQRWGLPNLLRVETQTYPSFDEAMITTAMTTTKELLARNFNPHWSASDANPIMPLVLFAREEQFRVQNLDNAGDGYVALNNGTLSFDLAPAGQPAAPLLLQAGLNWSAYCASPGAGGTPAWNACPSETYWDELARRHASQMAQPGDTPAMADGRLVLAQLYFLSVAQGVSRIVASDGAILAPGYQPLSDLETLSLVRSVRNGASAVVSGLLNIVIMARYTDKISVLEYLGRMINSPVQTFVGLGRSLIDKLGFKAGMTLIGVAVVAVVAALAVGIYFLVKYYLAGELGAKIAVAVLISGISLILSVIMPIITVVQWVQALQAAGVGTITAIKTVLSASSALTGTSKAAGIIGAIVATLVIWGFFIYAIVTSKTTPFSPEFNRVFAEAIAATIYVLILAVLSATVVGLIIVGIVALIDGILTAICELGVDDLRKVPGLDGACFTLGTTVTKALAKLIYSFDVMVDVERSDLIVTGAPDLRLSDPQRGFVAGNALSVQLPVTTTVVHKSPKPQDWMHILPYMWLFSQNNLRSSSFQYSLTNTPATITARRGQMNQAWSIERDRVFGATLAGVDIGKVMYRGQATSAHAPLTGINLPPGLNQKINFSLNIGYAVPAYECWTVPNPIPPMTPPVIPVCYVRTVDGNSSAMIADQIEVDILPATLGEFRALASDGNGGFRLAWDPAFTSLVDADNDGLRSRAHGGIDPDDATWDADGDGLSDALEIDRRLAGLAISPINWDTDGDGLTDAQELAFGTHPVRADTDNDGLTDAEEIFHQVYTFDPTLRRVVPTNTWRGGWMINVPGLPFAVRVSSDPTQADADGDGVTDQAERQLALAANPPDQLDTLGAPYHPRVFNQSPVAVYTTLSDPDRVVRPGQSLVYTTTVVGSSNLLVGGGLEVNANGSAFPDLLRGFALDFTNGQPNVAETNLIVAPNAPNGETTLNSVVKARLQGSNAPALSWQASQIGALGTFTDKQPRWTALAPAEPGRQDSYLLAGQAIGSQEFRSNDLWDPMRRGDVPVFALPGGQTVAAEADNGDTNSLLGSTGARLACDEDGNCMLVWSRYQNCGTVTAYQLQITGNSDESNGADIAVYFRRDPNFLRPGETEQFYVGHVVNLGTGGSLQINRSFSFCGTGYFDIYEFDQITFGPPPSGQIYLLSQNPVFLSAQERRFSNFSGRAQDGIVSGRIELTVNSQSLRPIAGTVLGPDASVRAPRRDFSNPGGTTAEDWGPVVASDGRDFLVAWERTRTVGNNPNTEVESQIVVRRFNRIGLPISDEVVLPVDQRERVIRYSPAPRLELDVAWIGGVYKVIWHRSDNTLRTADFDRDGNLVANSLRTLATRAQNPRLAYDPLSRQTLVVYNENAEVRGLVLMNPMSQALPFSINSAGFIPRVAYHPIARAWLVGWSDAADGGRTQRHRLIGPNGIPRNDLVPPSATWPSAPVNPSGTSLACPAISSEPNLNLPFEEFPGATSFADTSGRGGTASCSGADCPSAGIGGAGALIAPQSDFALNFDGQSQSLTVTGGPTARQGQNMTIAFWFRSNQTSGPNVTNWNQGAGLVTGSDLGISLSGGSLQFGVRASNTLRTIRSGPVADGNWHLATATLNASSMRLYIDGVQVANTLGVTLADGPLNLTLGRQAAGGNFYRGSLDQVMVFPTALSPAAVRAMFERTNQSYCTMAAPEANTLRLAYLRLNRNDPRGGLINVAGSLNLRVDGNAPSSSITAPANNSLFAAPAGATTLIIGGNASDPSSEVAQVEVSINGGPFEPANGAASWTFAATLQAGRNTLVTRATDVAGNVETPGPGIVVLVDGAAPTASFDPTLTTGPLAPTRLADGSWAINLSGTISDPPSGGQPGSGVDPASLQVTLLAVGNELGGPQGGSTVAANLNGERWQVLYQLPSAPLDPTGFYQATLRAADRVGNPVAVSVRLQVDANGPNPTLNADLREVAIITSTRSLTGSFDGAASPTAALSPQQSNPALLEARFLPVEQVAPLASALLLLPLDEAAGAVFFADRSTNRNDVACLADPCPTAGEPGRLDAAVRFAPGNQLARASTPALAEEASLSLLTWVQASGDGDLLSLASSNPAGNLVLRLAQGRPTLTLGGQTVVQGPSLGTGWHHLAAVLDRNAAQVQLYLDGTLVDSADLDLSMSLAGGALVLGGDFSGLLDEPTLLATALNPAQINALIASATVPWLPANISDANWSLAVPEGLEGSYQLDLRASDQLGNRTFVGNAWRVVIDTTAPRLNLAAETSGRSLRDASGNQLLEVSYRYEVRDRQLDERSLVGPCQNVPERSFADLSALDGLFGDLTLRDGLSVSCTRWESARIVPPEVRACDLYGNCSSARFVVNLDGTPDASQPGDPQAMVLSPAEGAVVALADDGTLAVQIAAEAGAGLAELRLELDGVEVARLDLRAGPALSRTLQTVWVRASEGARTLQVTALDRAGASQNTPQSVTFSADAAPPQVALDNLVLDESASLTAGSGMLSLSGTASDSLGLAAVQLRIGDGAFGDVTLGPDGRWATTRWFGWELATGNYDLTLRAIDWAGRISEVREQVTVDLTPLARVETRLTTTPAVVSFERNASFTFTGEAGPDRQVVSFRCRLNGGVLRICSSPQRYLGLPPGTHEFEVYAVDDVGNTDSTPARFTWRIEGTRQVYLPLIGR
ncbi:MAG: LamG-like jellyroll fold domain-containing protein [Oscillochloridaceae bacterium umkhey_bin13]